MARPFELGRIVMTASLEQHENISREIMLANLIRHGSGDWGEVDPGDEGLNELAIKLGARIMSVYKEHPELGKHSTFWIITEADRSSTTVLLPEDY